MQNIPVNLLFDHGIDNFQFSKKMLFIRKISINILEVENALFISWN